MLVSNRSYIYHAIFELTNWIALYLYQVKKITYTLLQFHMQVTCTGVENCILKCVRVSQAHVCMRIQMLTFLQLQRYFWYIYIYIYGFL